MPVYSWRRLLQRKLRSSNRDAPGYSAEDRRSSWTRMTSWRAKQATLATWAERVAAGGVSLMGEHRLNPQTRHRVSPSLPRACRYLFLSRPRRRFRAATRILFPFSATLTTGPWQDPPPGSAGVGQSPCPTVRANRTWPATTTTLPVLIPQWTRLQLRY